MTPEERRRRKRQALLKVLKQYRTGTAREAEEQLEVEEEPHTKPKVAPVGPGRRKIEL